MKHVLSDAILKAEGLERDEAASSGYRLAPCQEWRDMVEPIVRKCRLSAMLHHSTKFNAEGSIALASLLERMAIELDSRS